MIKSRNNCQAKEVRKKDEIRYTFYIQKIQTNFQCHEANLPRGGEKGERVIKVHEKILRGDRYVHYLD